MGRHGHFTEETTMTRTFAISDLHADVSGEGDDALRGLAAHINAAGRPEDVLLIGGDIGTDDASIARCLDLFRPFRGKKGAVAGNHDIWIHGTSYKDSLARHRAVQDIFRAGGFTPLEEEALVVGDVGYVGAMGWYDGTFSETALGIGEEAYASKTMPGHDRPIWADALRARWGASDKEVTAWQLGKLRARLADVAGVRDAIALVHHVPTTKLLPFPNARWLVPKAWRFANAFLGSERFSETLGGAPNVRTVVNGHIHRSGEAEIGGKRYCSIGGDYDKKQLLVIDDGCVARKAFAA